MLPVKAAPGESGEFLAKLVGNGVGHLLSTDISGAPGPSRAVQPPAPELLGDLAEEHNSVMRNDRQVRRSEPVRVVVWMATLTMLM